MSGRGVEVPVISSPTVEFPLVEVLQSDPPELLWLCNFPADRNGPHDLGSSRIHHGRLEEMQLSPPTWRWQPSEQVDDGRLLLCSGRT